MADAPRFSITTPIYYVNARPHIGHAYSTLVTDTIARHKRAQGYETWFLTGTDEHGQKIERSAKAAGQTPQELTALVSGEFRRLWDRMGFSYDDFIRTTEERHRKGVQKFFLSLQEKGYIYKDSYTGQYCVFDELYVDAPPGSPCPDCGRITETVSEENYFFKLSAFEHKLLDLYERQPEFIQPETRRNEIVSFVRGGLKDLSISRTSFDWGIPAPGDERHVIYVWLDALANYITALGYGSESPQDEERFRRFWPADVHLIGKEITRFHCVYWPAFLMAAGLPLPKSVVAHGWLLFEESKMSKSRGNIVRTETILDAFGGLKPHLPKHEQDLFGADVLRYFLLREIPFGQDGGFSFDALVQRYNSDLANGYGNLVSRTLAMIQRQFRGSFWDWYGSHLYADRFPTSERLLAAILHEPAFNEVISPVRLAAHEALPLVQERASETIKLFPELFNAYDFSKAVEVVWKFIATVDSFLTSQAPWKTPTAPVEDPNGHPKYANAEHFLSQAVILYSAAEAIRIITALLHPVIPNATAQVWAQLGLGDIEVASKNGDLRNLKWGGLNPGTKLGDFSSLFPRAEKDVIERMQEIEKKTAPSTAPTEGSAQGEQPAQAPSPAATAEPAGRVTGPAAKITIDDFAKVELRVAQIKVAERIPKADKLLRLEVDLGYETRQILAGIAETYAPESLIGRKVVIVANLAPRKMRGLESNGMIVAASLGEEGKPVLAGFLEEVEVGARLK